MKGLITGASWTGATAVGLVILAIRPSSLVPDAQTVSAMASKHDGVVAMSGRDTTFHQEVSWSPDGERLSISRVDIHLAYRSSVGVMNRDGSDYVELAGGTGDRWTSWSPSGDRIAFASSPDGHSDIYVISTSGSEPTRLTSASSNDTHPDWSPDGERIVFVSDRDSASDIYVMDASGGNVVRILRTDLEEWNPKWSPDGSRLAYYATAETGEDSVYVINADGAGRMTLDAGIWPAWSPDGSSLLYTLDGNVFSMTLKNRQRSLVAENAFFARWSPDGRLIAFIRTTWRAPEGWPSMSDIFMLDVVSQNETRITRR